MPQKIRKTDKGVARRLRQAMENYDGGKGIKAPSLGPALGKSPQAVYFWLETGNISREVIPKLCKVLGISEGWLVAGRPSPEGVEEAGSHYNVGEAQPYFYVPLVSWTQAGKWGEVVDLFSPGDAEEWVITTKSVGPKTFCLRVEGDSMENPNGPPTYPHGCKIIVDPDVAATNGARIVARYRGTQTFKQYVEDGGKVYLKPLNPRYPVIETTEEMEIIGCVVQTLMDW